MIEFMFNYNKFLLSDIFLFDYVNWNLAGQVLSWLCLRQHFSWPATTVKKDDYLHKFISVRHAVAVISDPIHG